MWRRCIKAKRAETLLPVLVVLILMLLAGVSYLSGQAVQSEEELPVFPLYLQDVLPVQPATCPGSPDLQDCGPV